jgi:hypothetical protein
MNILPSTYLNAPIIPAADYDGLIINSDLTNGLEVKIPIEDGIKPGDSFELTINGLLTGITHTFHKQKLHDQYVILTISPDYFEEHGNYAIAYQWTTYPGSTQAQSKATTVRIDRLAPGGMLLAPIVFPQISFGDSLY